MKVAVITPFYNEPLAWLEQAQRSVMGQSFACTHILVGDQARITPPLDGLVVHLPVGCKDYGDTPRAVGSMYAAGLGFDAIAYLDADNFYAANHIASLVSLHQASGAPIVTSKRAFHRLDGSYMAHCTASDGEVFCDTNCLFVTREAFSLLSNWALMPAAFHPIDDRVIWFHILQSGLARAHTGLATVGYRATHEGFYRDLGEAPPEGVKTSLASEIPLALQHWEQLGLPPA